MLTQSTTRHNGPYPRPASERFWKHVDPCRTDNCWQWMAAATYGGYGQFGIAYAYQVFAHRFAYELLIGPIAAGLQIDHLCKVRSCVNPEHLEAVTGHVNRERSSLSRNFATGRFQHGGTTT